MEWGARVDGQIPRAISYICVPAKWGSYIYVEKKNLLFPPTTYWHHGVSYLSTTLMHYTDMSGKVIYAQHWCTILTWQVPGIDQMFSPIHPSSPFDPQGSDVIWSWTGRSQPGLLGFPPNIQFNGAHIRLLYALMGLWGVGCNSPARTSIQIIWSILGPACMTMEYNWASLVYNYAPTTDH